MNRGKRPKIKITITDRRGKMGCHRGHHVGEVFDYDEDRGKICPMAMHCAFPYIDILRYGGSLPGQPEGQAEFIKAQKVDNVKQCYVTHLNVEKLLKEKEQGGVDELYLKCKIRKIDSGVECFTYKLKVIID